MASSEPLEILPQNGLKSPEILTISITDACNLVCRHCWVDAGVSATQTYAPVTSLRRIIEEFAALGGEGLRFTGGEPLCYPGWLELVQISRSFGFRTLALQTNGMLFKDQDVDALHELDFPGLSIQISLDGATEAAHDLVRGVGAFKAVMEGILKLVEAGLAPRISLFLTEMRHNLGEIPEMLDFADKMGIGSFSSGTMVLCGRAAETSLIAPPAVEQYLALIERFDQDDHFRALYARIGTVAALEWHKGESVRQECCTFVENPYLTPTGRLYPCLMCHADEYSVTGAFEKGLLAALIEGVPRWSSLHRASRCRADEIPECQICPVKPFCGGGCMGRAWGSYGNLLAADDRCSTRQAIHRHTGKSLL